jgi:transcriptional regulator with XRE-family HTH domain
MAVDDTVPMSPAELRAIRGTLGLSGDALARYLGVGPRALRRWEADGVISGRNVPPLVARVLRAAIQHPNVLVWLLDGKDPSAQACAQEKTVGIKRSPGRKLVTA